MSDLDDHPNDDNAMEKLLADIKRAETCVGTWTDDPLEKQWQQPPVEPDNRVPWTRT